MRRIVNTHGSQESNIFPIAVFLVIESIYRSLYTLWPAVTGTKRAIYFTHLPFGSGSYFQGGNVVTYVLRTTNTSISDLIFPFSIFLFSRCGNKNVCDVPVDSSIFGDPCPGTFKYIEVHYACRRGEFFQLLDDSIKTSIQY